MQPNAAIRGKAFIATIPVFNNAAPVIEYSQPLCRSIALEEYRTMNSRL
ncbi:hypothetical protein [Nitrosomonas ureae]|nr:hypothetical protein [Nitrosomonas ureae]